MTIIEVALVLTLITGVFAWYYRTKAKAADSRADAAESAMAALKSVNGELRASLDRVVADTAARNDREAHDDARTAAATGGDPQRVADLLNSLHSDRPGAGPGTRPGVPARAPAKLP